MKTQTSAKAYADFFESITPRTSLEEYSKVFDKKVYFEDPFQKITGVEKVYDVFEHMYATLHNPKFDVHEIICDKECAYLRWDFSYQRSSKHDIEKFTGVSRVQFLESGKVISHIDYWDAAENIYEKIPLLGAILRQIKKRITA